MNQIDIYYNHYHTISGDINEHFPTLKRYAEECDIIYELGTRAIVSTWALLAGNPKKLVTVDIVPPEEYGGSLKMVSDACETVGIDFSFILGNSLEIEIEEADLLFIDTIHTYDQLSRELKRHSDKVKKYIILHDTETEKDFTLKQGGIIEGGLGKAIEEFLKDNPAWSICEVFTNNEGLTILKRKHDENTTS